MPLFLIERQFADSLEIDAAGVAAIKQINADAGVSWLHSFLSGPFGSLAGDPSVHTAPSYGLTTETGFPAGSQTNR